MKNKGFITIIVIVSLAVIAAEIFALNGASNTITFQTNNAYIHAVEKNLAESGVCWAKANRPTAAGAAGGAAVSLDTAAVGIKNASISVKFANSGKNETAAISTFCSKGSLKLANTKNYRLD